MPGLHGRRGHNKHKYYVNDRDESPTRSIMSGDSPNAHKNDIFDFNKEGRSSPVPTTSKDIGVQSSGFVTTSVAVEPEKKDKEEPLEMCCPTLNEDPDDKRKNSESEDKAAVKDEGDRDRDKDDKQRKMNGQDKLDGVWVPPNKTRDSEQEDDDNCAVKCLYYTLQCCECSIM